MKIVYNLDSRQKNTVVEFAKDFEGHPGKKTSERVRKPVDVCRQEK